MADELHVVTMDEFEERSRELAHEVLQTGKPLFITDGDMLVARVLPPEASLDDIRHNLAVMDEIEAWADAHKGSWGPNADAVEMIDEQRR